MTTSVLVAAWFFTITSSNVSIPLVIAPKEIVSEDVCNGLRLHQLSKMLADGLNYNIGECYKVMVDPAIFYRDTH